MLKALVKKSKSNKGFTLIELIVVIAIIAILALILVPRFGGFTDRAKASADLATAKTLESAVTALLADGTIAGTGTIDIGNSTNVSSSGITVKTGLTLETEIQKLVGDKVTQQAPPATGYVVHISDGAVTSVDPNK